MPESAIGNVFLPQPPNSFPPPMSQSKVREKSLVAYSGFLASRKCLRMKSVLLHDVQNVDLISCIKVFTYSWM